MALSIIIVLILIVRGATLPGAIDGIRLYVGEFNGGQLVAGQIWQDALGQVFHFTGVGFGYYTAYASYNAKNSNAVQDAILICCCNSLFEIACGFAVCSIVGFMGLTPEVQGRVGSFVLGFITLPEGLTQMPGAQVWSVIFFFTLFMLAVSSAFVQLDTVVSVLCDTDRGRKIPRVYIVTACTLIAFLVSMMYNTEFGPQLLYAIDMNTKNIVLPFVVFAECYGATNIYRSMDPLIPSERQDESVRGCAPQVFLGVDDIIATSGLEDGHGDSSEGFDEKKEGEALRRSRTDSEDDRITSQPNDAAVALGGFNDNDIRR